MKKIVIEPGCITCGKCEFIAPELFEVLDVAYVKKDVDPQAFENALNLAIQSCPVQVIKCLQIDKKVDVKN